MVKVIKRRGFKAGIGFSCDVTVMQAWHVYKLQHREHQFTAIEITIGKIYNVYANNDCGGFIHEFI